MGSLDDLTTADVLNIVMRGYETLYRFVIHEGEVAIGRSRLYLMMNAGLVALATFGGRLETALIFLAGAVGLFANLIWIVTSLRAARYSSLWFSEIRRLEASLPALSAGRAGYRLYKGETIKPKHGHEIRMRRWRRVRDRSRLHEGVLRGSQLRGCCGRAVG